MNPPPERGRPARSSHEPAQVLKNSARRPSAPFPSLRCSVPPSPRAAQPTRHLRDHSSRLLSLLSLLSVSLSLPFTLLAADPARPSAVSASPTVPDVSFSVLRVFGALALVFALFLGAVWIFRNWQRLTLNRGRPSKLNVLEVRALGQRHAIYVIGYQQQRILLGTSPGGVSLLSHLPDDDSPPEAQPRAATFSEIWQHLRERKP